MLEVKVWGDWEYVFDAYNAVSRLSGSASIITAAAVIFVLGLFWSVFKSLADDKPGMPFKEMLIAMVLWTFFGSTIGAKEDIVILSHNDPSVFATVNDVPILIAWQGWIATNVLGTLREELQNEFTPVTYVSGSGSTDPLETLVNLYNTPIPPEISLAPPGNANNPNGGYDLKRTINAYMKNCYIADHELTGAEPTSPISAMRKSELTVNFFDSLRVDYDGLPTVTWLDASGSEFGEEKTCPEAFTEIRNALNNSSTRTQVQNFYSDKGLTSPKIADAIATIEGSFGTGPSASDIQLGLFAAYMVRDGLRNTSFETDIDMMVFQGARKRLFEASGEASLFTRLSKPMITLLETFAIFLYPVYVVLITLGSMGIKHLGKYFTLVIFINLWGIVKVFTDFYVIKSAESAFAAYENPFSFDGMPQTIAEVEAQLTVAAAAQAAIPAFCMFLVFGGVHALQGAMRQLSSASVDASYGAPSMYSSNNNGTRSGNTLTAQISSETGSTIFGRENPSDTSLGSAALSSGFSSATQGASQGLRSLSTSSSNAFNDTVGSAIKASNADQIQTTDGTQTMTQRQAVLQTVDALSERFAATMGGSKSDYQDLSYSVVAGGAVGVEAGVKLKGGADYKEAVSSKYEDKIGEIEEAVKQFNASLSDNESLSTAYNTATQGGNTLSEAAEQSTSDLYSQNEQIQQIDQVSESLGSSENISNGLTISKNLSQAEVAQSIDLDAGTLIKQIANNETGLVDKIAKQRGTTEPEDKTAIQGEIIKSIVEAYNTAPNRLGAVTDDVEFKKALEKNDSAYFDNIAGTFATDGSSLNNNKGTDYSSLIGLNTQLSKTLQGEEVGTGTATDAYISSDLLKGISDNYADKVGDGNKDVSILREMSQAYDEVGAKLSSLNRVKNESDVEKQGEAIIGRGSSLDTTVSDEITATGATVSTQQSTLEARASEAINTSEDIITLESLYEKGGAIEELRNELSDRISAEGDELKDKMVLKDIEAGYEKIMEYAENQDSSVELDKVNPVTAGIYGSVSDNNSANYGVVYGSTALMGTNPSSIKNLQPEQLMEMKAAAIYAKDNGIIDGIKGTKAGDQVAADFEQRVAKVDEAISKLLDINDNEKGGETREAVEYLANEVAQGNISSSTAETMLQLSNQDRLVSITNDFEDGTSDGPGLFSFTGAMGALFGQNTNYEANVTRQELDASRAAASQYLAAGDGNPLGELLKTSPVFNEKMGISDRGEFANWSKLVGDTVFDEYNSLKGEAALASVEARDRAMLYPETTKAAQNYKGDDLDYKQRANAISDAVYETGQRQPFEIDAMFSKQSGESKTGGTDNYALGELKNLSGVGTGTDNSTVMGALGYGSDVIKDTFAGGAYSQANNNGGANTSIDRALQYGVSNPLSNVSTGVGVREPMGNGSDGTSQRYSMGTVNGENGERSAMSSGSGEAPDASVFGTPAGGTFSRPDFDAISKAEIEELDGLASDSARGVFDPIGSENPVEKSPRAFETDTGDSYKAIGFVQSSDGSKEFEIYQNTATGDTFQYNGYRFKPYDDIGDMQRYNK